MSENAMENKCLKMATESVVRVNTPVIDRVFGMEFLFFFGWQLKMLCWENAFWFLLHGSRRGPMISTDCCQISNIFQLRTVMYKQVGCMSTRNIPLTLASSADIMHWS